MKKSTIILICLVQIFFILSLFAVYNRFVEKKTGYLDATMVFQDFKMKKQLEQEFMSIESQRKNELDSLELRLKLLGSQIEQNATAELRKNYSLQENNYYQKREEYAEINEMLMNKYNAQIWQRINQYAKEFGNQNNYTYIFGLTGNQGLLYAKENENITTSFLQFINDKYDGK
jgi:outer membrane protein